MNSSLRHIGFTALGEALELRCASVVVVRTDRGEMFEAKDPHGRQYGAALITVTDVECDNLSLTNEELATRVLADVNPYAVGM